MSESIDELQVWPIGALALVKHMLDVLSLAEIVDESYPNSRAKGT